MECIDCSDTGEGHVDNIAISETIVAMISSVALLEHVDDVGCSGLRSIKCGFGTEIDPTDRSWIEAIAVDEACDSIRSHRCGVLMGIWDSHCIEAKTFVQFVIVSAPKSGEVSHVEKEARKVNCNIIDSYVHVHP